MKKLYTIILLSISAIIHAQPRFNDITIVDDNIFLTDAVVDASGNTYVIGTFAGNPDFDPGTGVVNAPDPLNYQSEDTYNDAFIAKYNSEGVLAWVQAMWTRGDTGSGNDPFLSLRDLALDDSDNVFFVGDLKGIADGIGNQVKGSSTIGGGDSPRAFARGLSATGSIIFQGINSYENLSAGSTGNGIDVDATGNVYITGEFDYDINGFTIANSSNKQTYYTKFNGSGVRIDEGYLINSATSAYDVNRDNGGVSIAVQDNGSFLITGYFGQNAAFDGTTILSSVNQKDTYVAYYNSSEALLDVKTFSTAEEGRQVELDTDGNLYLSYGTNITRITNTGTTDWTRDFGYDVAFSINASNELLVTRLSEELMYLKLLSNNTIDFEISVPFIAGLTNELATIKVFEFTTDDYKWILSDIQDSNFDGSAPNENGSGIVIANYSPQTDFMAPDIQARAPALGATNVPLGQVFTVTFDEDIVLETGQGIVSIQRPNGTFLNIFQGNPDVSSSGSTLTFTIPGLEVSSTYQITLLNIQDDLGNEIDPISGWSITTGTTATDQTPPSISNRTPFDDAVDVPLDQTFSVTFDESIVLESGQVVVNLFKEGSLFSQFSEGNNNITSSGSTLSFTIPGLENSTEYSFQLLNIQDAAGNEITPTNQADWSFTTELEKPSVTTFLPINGATDILPRVGELVMNMSEDVLAGTGELRLRSVGSNTTIKIFQMGTSDVEISGSTVTLKNVPLLGYGSSYWIQNFNFNDDAISDLDGNTLEHWNTDATWSFTVREMIEWNGSSWVGGMLPGESDGASITGNYNTATDGALNITDLTISGGGIHVAFVADGNTVTEISGNLSVIGSGSLTVESGASLIILGTHSGNDITTKRNVTGNAGLSMVGSPILSMDIGNQGADYTYKYNDATQAWETVGLEIMQPGEGYFIGYNDPSPTLEFTGVPHTGDVTVSIPAGGYKLVANPYLAPIDNDGLFTAEQGVTTGAVWLWDDGGFNDGANRGGDYITISQAGTASGGSGASGNTYEGFYPSFQAFFVQGDADGGDLTFTPSMMVTSEGINADDHHFRKAEMEKIKLSLSNGEVFNELIVAFREDATEGQDFGLDAPKLEGATGLSFSSHFNNEHFAILGLPFPKGELSIPLELKVTEHGNYQLDVSEVIGLLDRYTISLRNNSTQRSIELGDGASLNLNLSAGTNSHFVLILSPQVVTGLADGLADLKILGWSTDHLDIYTMEARSRVSIFDLTGKSIYTAEHLSTTGEIRLQTSLESGKTYVLRVNDQSIKFILK